MFRNIALLTHFLRQRFFNFIVYILHYDSFATPPPNGSKKGTNFAEEIEIKVHFQTNANINISY